MWDSIFVVKNNALLVFWAFCFLFGNFDNIIFGGLIGWFIVDPLNGAMYNLSPKQIGVSLGEKSSHNNTATDGSISIILRKLAFECPAWKGGDEKCLLL